MTTVEDQLKNKQNFIGDNGNLYLTRCVACGRENYCLHVSIGVCCWCRWSASENVDEVDDGKEYSK